MFNKTIDLKSAPKSTQLIFVLFCIAFFLFVNHSMKNPPFYMALEEINENQQLKTLLGSPITSGYFVTGEASTVDAELTYAIHGSLNSADVYLYAEVVKGFWVLQNLEVTIDSLDKKIDVLAH